MKRGSFIIWVVVVALLVIVALFYFPALRSRIPGLRAPSAPSAPQTLVGEVESLDLGNLDAEFHNIDADLNQL